MSKSTWGGHGQEGCVSVRVCWEAANANLNCCGLLSLRRQLCQTGAGIQGDEKEMGGREGKSEGCVGVPLGGWFYETLVPTLCTTACCRILDDAADAELRASGCCVRTLRSYFIMHFTSNLAFQAHTAKPLPGGLTHSLFLFHCQVCFCVGG